MSSSLNSGGLLKSTSHASHSARRGAAKLAVDVFCWINGEEIKTETGGVYSMVKGQIGSNNFKALCSDAGLTLVIVYYCQRGIEALRDSSTREAVAQGSKASTGDSTRAPRMEDVEQTVKAMRDIINHDYLVLEINPGDSNMEMFFIVAQKGIIDGKPGIHIEHVPLKDKLSWVHKGVTTYSIPCNIKIPLKKIIKVLEEGDPHYNLRQANCWDYATAAAKRLVKECAHVHGITKEENIRLEKEHDDLEANLTKNSIVNSFKFFFELFFPSLTAGFAGMNSKIGSKEPAYKSSWMKQNVVAGRQNNVGGELLGIIGNHRVSIIGILVVIIGILGVSIITSFWGWKS